jgi:hypothetical protein
MSTAPQAAQNFAAGFGWTGSFSRPPQYLQNIALGSVGFPHLGQFICGLPPYVTDMAENHTNHGSAC